MARCGDATALASALQASRRDTLATFAAFEAALPNLAVPQRAEFNPPLWELGHIGWFQSWWLGRNPARGDGVMADPERPRLAPLRAGMDACYDSGRVPHATRWRLPLPDAQATRADLQAQLQQTLALLADWAADWAADGAADWAADWAADRSAGGSADAPTGADPSLYFFRLALLHEDMHHEAALYMAQALGVPTLDPRWQAPVLPAPTAALVNAGGAFTCGSRLEEGFAFDNELGAHAAELAPFEIDAQVVRWAEFLPFVEAGGYADARWWTAAGDAWRRSSAAMAPRYLRRDTGISNAWQQWRHGRWQALPMNEPACHLTQHEALAWCRWAGRRLPTEAEWEQTATGADGSTGRFRWGDVWEWTASPFAPYPGFQAHPYRDYSAPWFDGRPVLRGASFMTQPRLRHSRYRNYFPAARNDVPAGFRSCAIQPTGRG